MTIPDEVWAGLATVVTAAATAFANHLKQQFNNQSEKNRDTIVELGMKLDDGLQSIHDDITEVKRRVTRLEETVKTQPPGGQGANLF